MTEAPTASQGSSFGLGGEDGAFETEAPLVPLLKRHQVQVLLEAGHSQAEVSEATDLSVRTVRRIAIEAPVEHVDNRAERRKRRVGRPSLAAPFRAFVSELVRKEPSLLSVEVLRRTKLQGYPGSKSALYALLREVRPRKARVGMRFEGLPGEFSQHDFGEIRITFANDEQKVIRFFASRLKWSRWVIVTLVSNETAETLVRTLLDHFIAFGGIPLCAVFDRPKTVALSWSKDGTITEWNPIFAHAAMEIGFTAEVCWPSAPNQKGSVENIVGWVKGSFFKQRRFHDLEDLKQQLGEWLTEVNDSRPCRATGQIPTERLVQDRSRLRPPRCTAQALALRIPVQVGPTAEVSYDGRGYSMPPEAAGLSGTLYLYRERIRIVAGRFEALHPRFGLPGSVSRLPEHRAAHLAAIAGKRGKRYLKRQQVLEVGQSAVSFLTELVHRNPQGWIREVDELHEMLQALGAEPLERAFRAALESGRCDSRFVAQTLGWNGLGPRGHATMGSPR
ncbi:IS21 family transposase [bacterium]|nr:IS21 family transposase [bacterium]